MNTFARRALQCVASNLIEILVMLAVLGLTFLCRYIGARYDI
jgi:hypothetical protein